MRLIFIIKASLFRVSMLVWQQQWAGLVSASLFHMSMLWSRDILGQMERYHRLRRLALIHVPAPMVRLVHSKTAPAVIWGRPRRNVITEIICRQLIQILIIIGLGIIILLIILLKCLPGLIDREINWLKSVCRPAIIQRSMAVRIYILMISQLVRYLQALR